MLRALASRGDSSGLSEVGRAADLPKSTVARILAALEDLGMVEKVGGRWVLGPGLATLTHQATPVGALRELARPYLVQLAETLGENAALAIEDGGEVLYIDTATSPGAVQVRDWTGDRVPFHTAAAGFALMSTWSDERLRDHVAAGLEARTSATITTLDGLRSKLVDVRRDGAAWTLSEFSDEVNGLAAPIVGADGEAIGSLNVYGPTYRFPGPHDELEVAAVVTDACAHISARLSGPRPAPTA